MDGRRRNVRHRRQIAGMEPTHLLLAVAVGIAVWALTFFGIWVALGTIW